MSAKRKVKGAKASFLASLHAPTFSKVIYLFTEGDTEFDYIQQIAKSKNVSVDRIEQVSSPHVLMQKARDWAYVHRKDIGDMHEVWVLFDDDEKTADITQTTNEMGNLPAKANPKTFKPDQLPPIRVGYMKPCIELWGIMAIQGDVNGVPMTHDKVESKLAEVMKGYCHKDARRYFKVEQMKQTDKAIQMAASWEKTHGKFPDCINATRYAGIHGLVSMILKSEDSKKSSL